MIRNKKAYVFIIPFLFFSLSSKLYLLPAGASDVLSLYNRVVSITVNEKDGTKVGTASGFIIEQGGIIATSCSILSEWYEDVQNTMTVTMYNTDSFPLEDVLSYNCRKNVALIKINKDGLPSLKLATDHTFKKGEDVIVLNPFLLDSKGIKGKVRNVSGDFNESNFSVAPEMSGSPVLTEKGKVLGIATLIVKRGKKISGIVAAQEIKKQLDRYKKYVKSFQTKGARSLRSHDPSESVMFEENKIQIIEKPDNPIKHYLIGCDQMRLKMYEDAIESFKAFIDIKPDYGNAYVNLGNTYYKTGRYAEAADSYRAAISIMPGTLFLYNKLGTVLIIFGDYKQAIESFNEAVRIDPKNAEIYYNLGIAYFLDGDRSAITNVHNILKGLDRERARSLMELFD